MKQANTAARITLQHKLAPAECATAESATKYHVRVNGSTHCTCHHWQPIQVRSHQEKADNRSCDGGWDILSRLSTRKEALERIELQSVG